MANTVRTNISIPAPMKARMDAVTEPVNWSAVACSAFEQKLGELIARRGAKDMQEVVERLRASKRKIEGQDYSLGFANGQEWAKHRAETIELQRIAEERDRCGGGWESAFTSGPAHGAGGWIAAVIDPNVAGVSSLHRDFWLEVISDGDCFRLMEEPSFIRGFTDGALNIWDTVADQL